MELLLVLFNQLLKFRKIIYTISIILEQLVTDVLVFAIMVMQQQLLKFPTTLYHNIKTDGDASSLTFTPAGIYIISGGNIQMYFNSDLYVW